MTDESVLDEILSASDYEIIMCVLFAEVLVGEMTEQYRNLRMEALMHLRRKCHYKAAIGERNKWLAENCDMMIVYIKRDYGGAYKCYKHAQELGVPIMNIADNIKNQEW